MDGFFGKLYGAMSKGGIMSEINLDLILQKIVQEKTNKEIAEDLNTSEKNVERIIKKLCRLFKVKSKVGLTREYMRELKSGEV